MLDFVYNNFSNILIIGYGMILVSGVIALCLNNIEKKNIFIKVLKWISVTIMCISAALLILIVIAFTFHYYGLI